MRGEGGDELGSRRFEFSVVAGLNRDVVDGFGARGGGNEGEKDQLELPSFPLKDALDKSTHSIPFLLAHQPFTSPPMIPIELLPLATLSKTSP